MILLARSNLWLLLTFRSPTLSICLDSSPASPPSTPPTPQALALFEVKLFFLQLEEN